MAYIGKNVTIKQDARVSGNACVSGDAHVSDDAHVYGVARVCGNALVAGNASVCGNAHVSGDAAVAGDAYIDTSTGCMSAVFRARTGFYTLTLYTTARGTVQANWGCRREIDDLRKYLSDPSYDGLRDAPLKFLEAFELANGIKGV